MAPQFVKPYVKSNKNDAADAEAICEAVARPSMRFVPVKNAGQQAMLALDAPGSGSSTRGRRKPTQSGGCWANTARLCPRA